MTACPTCGEPLGEDGLCAACLLGDALETKVTRFTEGATPSAGDDLAFDHFGPYTILRVLGEGGMGAVYLAEQHEPIHRKVALKVIKLGLDSRSILSRFNYERQTVAMMDHPNIARVYEASATAKGRPYFVMEYIEGLPITEYCDRHRLNTRQRLDLFIPVCHAVQHAHSKGILHRDIKPSNVLVMEVDGTPVPKVIDFGIAKATDQQKLEQTALTQFGQFVGTPEYMSPEAADLVGGGVDTTSDVYSLGVMLYELLVGAVPFDGKSLRKAGMAELLRVMREEDAPSLPAKLTSHGQTLADIAARRASTPVALRREVSGELNLITLKAVEKDRTRRYDSARALGEDIERFLDSRPVKACPPTLSYRLRKYTVKHRGAVAAAAALVLAVTAGAAATIWQARNAIRERGVAVAERAEAMAQRTEAMAQRGEAVQQRTRAEVEMRRATEQERLAAASAQDVRSLANSMLFELDDQLKDTGSTATRTKLLELGLRYLQRADASDPNLGAAYFRIAELQDSLMDRDRAEASYRRAAELLRARLARNPRDSESRRLMARASLALVPRELLYYEERVKALKEAENGLRSLIADEPRNGRAMLDLSRVLLTESASGDPLGLGGSLGSEVDRDPGEAVAWAEKGATGSGNMASDLIVLAKAQMQMSGWVVNQRNATDAVDWAGRAVATLERASREAPSNTAVLAGLSAAYLNLAAHHADRDELAKATEAANRALEAARQAAAIDPENPSHRVQSANCQGRLAQLSADAGMILQQVLSGRTNPLRPASAQLSADAGTFQQYRAATEEAARIYREQIERHPDVLEYRRAFASWSTAQTIVEFRASNFREALQSLERAIEDVRYVIKQKPADLRASSFLPTLIALSAYSHGNLREFSQARAAFEEALSAARAMAARNLGVYDLMQLANIELLLSTGSNAMGESAAALEHIKAGSAIVHRMRDAARSDRRVLLTSNGIQRELASQCFAQQDTACARSAIEEVRPVLEARYAENPYDSLVINALLGNLFVQRTLYLRSGQTSEQLAASRRSVEIAKKALAVYAVNPDRQRSLQAAQYNLSSDFRLVGLRDEALAVNREQTAAIAQRLAAPPAQTDAKLNLVQDAGNVIRQFQSLREYAEALRLSLLAIPFAEAIAQKDPNNHRAGDLLLTTLADASMNSVNTGRLAEAIDLSAREAALRSRAPRTSADFFLLGQRQVHIANLEERRGNTEAAARGRDAAMETLRKSYDVSEKALMESKGQSAAELSNMEAARRLSAILSEHQGKLDAASRAAEESLDLAGRLAAAQPTTANRTLQSNARARVFRLLELAGAADAEFQRHTGSTAPLGAEGKQALLAEGWRLAAADVGTLGYRPNQRVVALERAVAGHRSLLRGGAPERQKIELAVTLYNLADTRELIARQTASPAEAARLWEDARAPVQECLEILESLRAAGTLPQANLANWSNAKILQAGIQSKLAGGATSQLEPRP